MDVHSVRRQAGVRMVRVVLIVFALGIGFRGLCGVEPPHGGDKYLDEGLAQFRAGEFDRAISGYSEAIRQNPRLALAWLGRSMAYAAKNWPRLEVALGAEYEALRKPIEDDYLQALRLDADPVERFKGWGGAKAEEDVSQFMKRVEILAATHSMAGDARIVEGKFDEAFLRLTRAIELLPDNPHFRYTRGFYYSSRGQFDKANADFNEVERIYRLPQVGYRGGASSLPHDDETCKAFYVLALQQRAKVFEKQGDTARAQADYATIRALGGEATKTDLAPHAPEAARESLNQGLAQFRGGDLDSAIASYSEAIRQDPQKALAWLGRSLAYALKNGPRLKKASGAEYDALSKPIEDDYAEAQRLDPHVIDAYKRWAGDRAEAEVTTFLDRIKTLAAVLGVSANALMSENKIDEALAELSRAIRFQPDEPLLRYSRGLFSTPEHLDQAIGDFNHIERLQQANPEDETLHSFYRLSLEARAIAYRYQGDSRRAIADLDQLIRLSRNLPETCASALRERGVTLLGQNERDRALADFDESIRLNPKDHRTFYRRALVLADQGKLEQAHADLTVAIRLNSRHAESFYARGFGYLKQHSPDQAISDFDEAIRLEPKFQAAYFQRGLAHLEKKNADQSLADFEKVLSLYAAGRTPNASDLVLLYRSRGQAYELKRESTKARAEYARAEQLAIPVQPPGNDRVDRLIEDLKSDDWAVRGAAAQQLEKVGDARAVGPLFECLQAAKTEGKVEWKIFQSALLHIKDPRAVETYILHLQQGNAVAAKAIRNFPDPRAVDALVSVLTDPEFGDVYQFFWEATESLCALRDVRAVAPMIDALRHESDEVRANAAKVLGPAGDRRAVEPLIAVLQSDTGFKPRLASAISLGLLADRRAVNPLMVALQSDGDAYVRLQAATALGNIGDARAIEVLTTARADRDPQVQQAARAALTKVQQKGSSTGRLESDPPNGATGVDPATQTITIRFPADMQTESYTVVPVEDGQTPQPDGLDPYAFRDARSFVMNVRLAPETAYAFSLNSASRRGFKLADGTPLPQTVIRFRTGPAATLLPNFQPAGEAEVLYVSTQGDGVRELRSIADALKKAKPGGKIVVRPGTYVESVLLDKQIEISGEGARESIILISTSGPCLSMQTEQATVKGLTLRGQGSTRSNQRSPEFFAVDVPRGHLVLEDCAVTSGTWSAVVVHGESARADLRNCVLHDSNQGGLFVFKKGAATLEDSEVFGNALAGVLVASGGHATVQRCKIHDGKQGGVYVYEQGAASLNDCDIYRNAMAGVEVGAGAEADMSRCRLFEGAASGVFVHDKGQATLNNCDIFGNALANVIITTGGNPTLRKCKIYDGLKEGVSVGKTGLGTLEECEIYGNAGKPVSVDSGGKPTIRDCRINGEVYVPEADGASSSGDDAAENRAIAALKALGAVVHTYPSLPGKPVKVDFTPADFNDADLAHLKAIPRLTLLSLSFTDVNDASLAHIQGLLGVEYLGLNKTKITDAGLAHLKGLRSLVSLDLTDTKIEGPGLRHLSSLPILMKLKLAGTQVDDLALDSLKTHTGLYAVELDGTRVTGAGLASLSRMIDMERLSLNGLEIDDASLVHLKEMKNLKALDLSFTKVTDAGLARLTAFDRLEELELVEDRITDAGLTFLRKMKQLQSLDLTLTKVTDRGLRSLQQALPEATIVN